VDRASYEADLALEVAATLANAQMHLHPPALEPTELAILCVRNEFRNLSASQQCLALLAMVIQWAVKRTSRLSPYRTSAIPGTVADSCALDRASPSSWSR